MGVSNPLRLLKELKKELYGKLDVDDAEQIDNLILELERAIKESDESMKLKLLSRFLLCVSAVVSKLPEVIALIEGLGD